MQFLMVDVYYEKEICYSDNINKKAEYKLSDQMEEMCIRDRKSILP